MKRSLARAVALAFAACLPWVFVPASSLAQALPAQGERARLAEPRPASKSQRVVSLSPTLTEMVCALGACDRLVGVDRFSNHPRQVQALPKLGGHVDPSLEAVLAVKPDLVLVGTSSRLTHAMQRLGLQVVALEPTTQAQAKDVFLKLGELLSVADASSRWHDLQAPWSDVLAQKPAHLDKARVYIEVAGDPYAAGAASFMGEIAAQMGLRNIVDASMGPFPRLNAEFVVRANPQIIISTSTDLAAMKRRPGWSAIEAVRLGRVCRLRGTQADAFSRAGVRQVEAARAIVACLSR
jgi:iron complex transport system substrate-binding protein